MSEIDPAMPYAKPAAMPANRANTPQNDPEWEQRQRDQHDLYLKISAAWIGNPNADALHTELTCRARGTHAVHLMCSGRGGREFDDRDGWHRSGLSVVLQLQDGIIRTRLTTSDNERPGMLQVMIHGGSVEGAEFGVVPSWKCGQCGRRYRTTQAAILNGAARAINEGIRHGKHFAWRVPTRTLDRK